MSDTDSYDGAAPEEGRGSSHAETTEGRGVQSAGSNRSEVDDGVRLRLVMADRPPYCVPVPPTALVGREREAAEAAALLRRDDVRLLTLTGPGGVGKTRLALEVAARLTDEFEDGAAFVELAPIHDPDLVIHAVAGTLGVRDAGDRSLVTAVRDNLRDQQMLLVLDNVEQVVAATPVVAELLAGAPRVTILATSRTPLRLRAEHEFPLAPLALPAGDQPPLADLAANDAVILFVQRARAVNPDLALTARTGRSRRSAAGSTGCRWHSSWRRPAPGCCRPRPSWRGWTSDCRC